MSFFHRVKKTINQISEGTQIKDPAFDDAAAKFEAYQAQVIQVNQGVSGLMAAIAAYVQANSVATRSMAKVLEAAPPRNEQDKSFVEVSVLRDRQQSEFHKEHLTTLKVMMTNSAQLRLTELVESNRALKARITQRNELLQELDYYTGKVAKLQRQQQQAKNFSLKEQNRVERNEQKQRDLQKQFQPLNEQLTKDLVRVWNGRFKALGTVLRDTALLQQRFGELLVQSADLSQVPLVESDDFGQDEDVLPERSVGSAVESSVAIPGDVFVRAEFDLAGEEDGFLTLQEGDVVRLLKPVEDWSETSQWVEGELCHKPGRPKGLLPLNYVTRLAPGEELLSRDERKATSLDDFLDAGSAAEYPNGDSAAGFGAEEQDQAASGAAEAESDVLPSYSQAVTSSSSNDSSGNLSKAAEDGHVYVRVLYDLNTQDEENLVLEEGDVLRVLASAESLSEVRWASEEAFWVEGEQVDSQSLQSLSPPLRGMFPSNYVERYK